MLRTVLFLISIVYAIVLHLAHGAGRSSVVSQNSVQNSPLQNLLERGNLLATEVLDADAEIMMQIYRRSTLQLKMVVIAETVVPYDDRHLLSIYVQRQLHASDVMSDAQQRAVLAMVDMAPAEAAVSNEEIGEIGSLRNSAVLSLFKRQDNNIHFMLIGVRAEPRLGWNWIPNSQRNSWNDVLSRVLTNKIRKEAKNCVWRRDTTVSDPPKLSWIGYAMRSKEDAALVIEGATGRPSRKLPEPLISEFLFLRLLRDHDYKLKYI